MFKLMRIGCFTNLQNVLQHVTVNIDSAEDVPEDVRERALYRYLTNLKPETFDGHYSDIWREYGTLLMAENLLDLARKANVSIRTLYTLDLTNW